MQPTERGLRLLPTRNSGRVMRNAFHQWRSCKVVPCHGMRDAPSLPSQSHEFSCCCPNVETRLTTTISFNVCSEVMPAVARKSLQRSSSEGLSSTHGGVERSREHSSSETASETETNEQSNRPSNAAWRCLYQTTSPWC